MRNCLIVDDSKVIRKVARHILEGLSFQVDEAADGEVGLRRCDEAAPDVILLDWNMPVMGGMEFLKAFRARPYQHLTKIIFCTTENGLGHISAAIAAGADEYVMKPFDRDMIASKLQLVGSV